MNREETIAELARTYFGLATLDCPEEPTDFLGHFTTATRVALTLAYDAGLDAGRTEPAELPADAAESEAGRRTLFEAIAKQQLRIPTLAHRKSDRLDFHTVSVWSVQAALEAAYAAGHRTPPPPGEPDADPGAVPAAGPDTAPRTVVEHHRNGVGGAPFDVLLFTDSGPHGSRKLGIVFAAERHVAVFDLAKLAAGDIAFGSNSWRGDQFERTLRWHIAERDRTDA